MRDDDGKRWVELGHSIYLTSVKFVPTHRRLSGGAADPDQDRLANRVLLSNVPQSRELVVDSRLVQDGDVLISSLAQSWGR